MTAGLVRVVFDTNILVSGHFWKGSPYRCLLAVEAGLAVMVLSDPILAELDETLTVKFGVSKAEVDSILKRLRTGAERTQIEGKSGWVALDLSGGGHKAGYVTHSHSVTPSNALAGFKPNPVRRKSHVAR